MQKKLEYPPPLGMTLVLGGVPARACSPEKFLKKRCFLVHSERSKIINLKINNFRDNKSTTTKNIRHILSSINPDVHVNKQKHESPPPPPQ